MDVAHEERGVNAARLLRPREVVLVDVVWVCLGELDHRRPFQAHEAARNHVGLQQERAVAQRAIVRVLRDAILDLDRRSSCKATPSVLEGVGRGNNFLGMLQKPADGIRVELLVAVDHDEIGAIAVQKLRDDGVFGPVDVAVTVHADQLPVDAGARQHVRGMDHAVAEVRELLRHIHRRGEGDFHLRRREVLLADVQQILALTRQFVERDAGGAGAVQRQ